MDIIIFGGGGHAKVIADIIRRNHNDTIAGIVSKEKDAFWDIPALGNDDGLPDLRAEYPNAVAFVAIGDNAIRKKVTEKVIEAGFDLLNIISDESVISPLVHTAEHGGIVIMPGVILNAEVRIGKGTIVNTGAVIDHECMIGDFVHIAPGCAISGKTRIGDHTFIGTGASIIDKIQIGADCMIGAGAVVVRDVPDHSRVAGVPARDMQAI